MSFHARGQQTQVEGKGTLVFPPRLDQPSRQQDG
jgi:hypothetical protein